jgi:integrase/recombinase XerC
VDSHTLRKTAIALVERASSHEVARAFAGHAESNVTSHNAPASIEEVAAVVGYLHGQSHPLAPDNSDDA